MPLFEGGGEGFSILDLVFRSIYAILVSFEELDLISRSNFAKAALLRRVGVVCGVLGLDFRSIYAILVRF